MQPCVEFISKAQLRLDVQHRENERCTSRFNLRHRPEKLEDDSKKGFSGTQSDSLLIKLGGKEEKGGAVRC